MSFIRALKYEGSASPSENLNLPKALVQGDIAKKSDTIAVPFQGNSCEPTKGTGLLSKEKILYDPYSIEPVSRSKTNSALLIHR